MATSTEKPKPPNQNRQTTQEKKSWITETTPDLLNILKKVCAPVAGEEEEWGVYVLIKSLNVFTVRPQVHSSLT